MRSREKLDTTATYSCLYLNPRCIIQFRRKDIEIEEGWSGDTATWKETGMRKKTLKAISEVCNGKETLYVGIEPF